MHSFSQKSTLIQYPFVLLCLCVSMLQNPQWFTEFKKCILKIDLISLFIYYDHILLTILEGMYQNIPKWITIHI